MLQPLVNEFVDTFACIQGFNYYDSNRKVLHHLGKQDKLVVQTYRFGFPGRSECLWDIVTASPSSTDIFLMAVLHLMPGNLLGLVYFIYVEMYFARRRAEVMSPQPLASR